MTTLLNDFTDYLQTVILGKEQLMIVGDFTIHVDVPLAKWLLKFLGIARNFFPRNS